jgi:hypothetical protein
MEAAAIKKTMYVAVVSNASVLYAVLQLGLLINDNPYVMFVFDCGDDNWTDWTETLYACPEQEEANQDLSCDPLHGGRGGGRAGTAVDAKSGKPRRAMGH